MALRLLLGAAVLAAAAPAQAQIMVDQIERLDVEAGETEWELQAVHAQAANGEASASALNFSGEFGISDHWALGFELETERDGAAALAADLFALQAKFVAVDPEESPVGLGAQISLGRSLHGGDTEADVRLLAEARLGGNLVLASDITFESLIVGDERHDIFARYGARLDWRRSWGVLGVEAGGDWGALDDLRWSADDRHWIGPVASVDVASISIEAAAFAGLTEATPDLQFRLQLALH